MANFQFQPGFDVAAYLRAKDKARNSNKVAGHSGSNKRLSVSLDSRPELIETRNDERIPLIVEAFSRRLRGQSETPTNQQEFASQQPPPENEDGNRSRSKFLI